MSPPWMSISESENIHLATLAQMNRESEAHSTSTIIYQELRESERQAIETLALEPVLRDAASQEPMLRCRWRQHLGHLALAPDKGGPLKSAPSELLITRLIFDAAPHCIGQGDTQGPAEYSG